MKNVIKITIALIILLSVSTFFAQKTENKVILDKSIRVLNFSKYTYADTIVNIGVSTLKIKNVNVVIVPLSFKEELNPFLLGYIEYNDNYYIIKLSSYLSRDEAILVVAHELIHLHDFYYKRLIFTKESIIFDGVHYSPYMEYSNRPWEISAFYYERVLKSKIEKKLY